MSHGIAETSGETNSVLIEQPTELEMGSVFEEPYTYC